MGLVIAAVGVACWVWCVLAGDRVPRLVLCAAAGFFGAALGAHVLRLAQDPTSVWDWLTATGTVYGLAVTLRRAYHWRRDERSGVRL